MGLALLRFCTSRTHALANLKARVERMRRGHDTSCCPLTAPAHFVSSHNLIFRKQRFVVLLRLKHYIMLLPSVTEDDSCASCANSASPLLCPEGNFEAARASPLLGCVPWMPPVTTGCCGAHRAVASRTRLCRQATMVEKERCHEAAQKEACQHIAWVMFVCKHM